MRPVCGPRCVPNDEIRRCGVFGSKIGSVELELNPCHSCVIRSTGGEIRRAGKNGSVRRRGDGNGWRYRICRQCGGGGKSGYHMAPDLSVHRECVEAGDRALAGAEGIVARNQDFRAGPCLGVDAVSMRGKIGHDPEMIFCTGRVIDHRIGRVYIAISDIDLAAIIKSGNNSQIVIGRGIARCKPGDCVDIRTVWNGIVFGVERPALQFKTLVLPRGGADHFIRG